jgi:hypothetical protein
MKFAIRMIACASMLMGLFSAGSWAMWAQQRPAVSL